jgi:hypothetical protein
MSPASWRPTTTDDPQLAPASSADTVTVQTGPATLPEPAAETATTDAADAMPRYRRYDQRRRWRGNHHGRPSARRARASGGMSDDGQPRPGNAATAPGPE